PLSQPHDRLTLEKYGRIQKQARMFETLQQVEELIPKTGLLRNFYQHTEQCSTETLKADSLLNAEGNFKNGDIFFYDMKQENKALGTVNNLMWKLAEWCITSLSHAGVLITSSFSSTKGADAAATQSHVDAKFEQKPFTLGTESYAHVYRIN